MSERWPGGIISQTAPVPSGPYQDSTAPGIWTMEQAAYWRSQGNWPTPGSVNPSAFIENLFQTWLYTGNGSSQTITNGIDLAGKGGMVWTKARSASRSNNIVDTVRGGNNMIYTDATDAQFSLTGLGFSAFIFNSAGYTASNAPVDAQNGATFVSWTFREQPKFFDVVTYTGNGTDGRAIAHNLGSTPGMIIIKSTSIGTGWPVYHRGMATANPESWTMFLNTTAGRTASGTWGNAPTSTDFYVNNLATVNQSGDTYVAYLFAHNAGGFGLTGTDNVISCGSYTGNGSANGPTINLGYEPQWVLQKRVDSSSNWHTQDIMRGMPVTGNTALLLPNSSTTEYDNIGLYLAPNATGFQILNTDPAYNASGGTYIYMAIRRGPMATPTLGTQVFSVTAGTFSTPYTVTTGFPVDLAYNTRTNGSSRTLTDRLRGPVVSTSYNYLQSNSTVNEVTGSGFGIGFQNNTAIIDNDFITGGPGVWWNFRRAPGFFDIVCYTGTGSSTTYAHNLGVVPQIIIYRARGTDGGTGGQWAILTSDSSGVYYFQLLNSNLGNIGTDTAANYGLTASTFNPSLVGWNTSSVNYVSYLFASVAGVSKVGSYTGTGGTQTINCGFTTGARFVLIKRTDSSGDWWIWDTARGMIAGTDPRITANTTAVQINNNWVYTESTGFQIVTSDAAVNASGGSYNFLAIA